MELKKLERKDSGLYVMGDSESTDAIHLGDGRVSVNSKRYSRNADELRRKADNEVRESFRRGYLLSI